jgi:hypothetical protein
MNEPPEPILPEQRAEFNAEPREALEARFGQVWNTEELARDFVVTAIIGTSVVVRRKSDDAVGSLEFQNEPRFYFDWKPHQASE